MISPDLELRRNHPFPSVVSDLDQDIMLLRPAHLGTCAFGQCTTKVMAELESDPCNYYRNKVIVFLAGVKAKGSQCKWQRIQGVLAHLFP